MQRRNFLAGTATATALSRPAAVAKTNPRVLRYVPQADLTVIDPVMTTAYITRYHATMVWDQLYGIDSQLQPRPQMVEGHTIEDDGRLWTFTLRDGLRFHRRRTGARPGLRRLHQTLGSARPDGAGAARPRGGHDRLRMTAGSPSG